MEKEREKIEFCRQQEELRLQQHQREQELQQQEDELHLQQHERELENERKKTEADEEQKRIEIELTKGSSGASRSQVDDLESIGSRRNLERTVGWTNSVAQQSGPSRPLPPNVLIDPSKNVTQDRSDKSFSTYPKTTPLFQPGAGLFSTQLQDSSILKKPEIPKSIRVTEPQTFLPKTTFAQQEPLAFQNMQKRQSPKNNYRNRSLENQIQTAVSQATPQVVYQPSGDPRGLPKLKLTEFSGDPWSGPSGQNFSMSLRIKGG